MTYKLILFFFMFSGQASWAQMANISGKVTDDTNKPLVGVTIKVKNSSYGVISTNSGFYRLIIPADDSLTLTYSHVGYSTAERIINAGPGQDIVINVVLNELTEILKVVEIEGSRSVRDEAGLTQVNPKNLDALPSPYGDFNKVLSTLPGVISNNELSSSYSVRGGSYDENLIYVNDIPVYRPFLISNGQQEGLSFVNSNLVKEVTFSAGGWQPKYGDKLSSVLNVHYKKPESFGASFTAGLLGGSAHVEGATSSGAITYIAGVRHKSAKYLLNTLDTQGEYLPKFSDAQAFVNIRLNERTSLGVLGSYARNRYAIQPQSRVTEFGTFDHSFRLFVGFEGRELMEYDTWQGGWKLSRAVSDRWKTELITSGVYAAEREFTDIEGAYRLCDVDKNPSSDTFNECVYVRGTGSNYDYGRNTLNAKIINIESRNQYIIDKNNELEFGLGYSYEDIEDQLHEYSFKDSADYVTDIETLQANNTLASERFTGFVQHTGKLFKHITTSYGVRINYWNVNQQLLVSPRAQFSFRPEWTRDIVFTMAAGVYQQPPFYRELRGQSGKLNLDLRAQTALHLIGGLDHNFKWWDRDFKFTGEMYYKRFSNVVIYDVDNVKLRYYANNDATAYATGLDLRISGEFIEGAESWFSLGILNAREDAAGDNKGYIKRPTDQRVSVAVFFQDHLPNNPTFRVSLNLFYGSGLPFGPPENFQKRNSFNGDTYKRLDIGFSKVFSLSSEEKQQLIVSAEILNLFGVSNTISYTWISDLNNAQIAVPNTLSARLLNLKVAVKI